MRIQEIWTNVEWILIPLVITAFREAFILKWLACAIKGAGTYQEIFQDRTTPRSTRAMAQRT
jgi:hypothetical protein